MQLHQMSNQAVLQEIGRRLAHERLSRNLTQSYLANQAGIARRTLVAAEAGEGMTMGTFISLMRELGLLNHLDALLPEPQPSPIQMVQLRGHTRKRASSPRKLKVGEPPTPWRWKE
jgi:transcriptional regulator with XRE-family HTH domain